MTQRAPQQTKAPIVRRRYLPSLGSFATFEVAAKHLSFTVASQELNVTQAAISQQIRALEKALGAQLFLRKHNALDLTQEGQTLLRAVTMGLDALAQAAEQIGQAADDRTITCAGTNAAITYWFRPLTQRFCLSHPDTRFVLLASDENETLSNLEEVDLALVCGRDRRSLGEDVTPLFPESVEPVCSPDYLSQVGPIAASDQWAHMDLLELHRMHWTSEAISWHPIGWEDWLRDKAPGVQMPVPTLTTNNFATLMEAALDGAGVMLGWRHLVQDALDSGKLVRMSGGALDSGRMYHLKRNRARRTTPRIDAFAALLSEQGLGSQEG